MSEEQSGGVTVLYGSGGVVNFPKAQYLTVDAQGVLTVYVDSQHYVALFPSGGWNRAFNLNVDQPKKALDPGRQ